jgi:hypothetical protein
MWLEGESTADFVIEPTVTPYKSLMYQGTLCIIVQYNLTV